MDARHLSQSHAPRYRTNGQAHYDRLTRSRAVHLDRTLGHGYRLEPRRRPGVFTWRRMLELILGLVLFWLGVALLFGWRPA